MTPLPQSEIIICFIFKIARVRFDATLLNCVQGVAINIKKGQKIHQNIKKYRNQENLEFRGITGEILYFMRLSFESSFLNTAEVRGSNPAPTILFLTDHSCLLRSS